MKKNHSPWLYQLRKDRTSQGLGEDIKTEVAIIGAGIAGISTAYFLLKNTNKNIVVLEHYKLAHGATGHNAGQVVSYFERGFASLVDEFGLDLATAGQRDIEEAWNLLDEMYTSANLDIPFARFLGHAGLSNYDQVLLHLKNNLLRKKGGLVTERIIISDKALFLSQIPEEYTELFTIVPQEEILNTCETNDEQFVAVISFPKGCINSALFCEEVMLYLLETYKDRVKLYEHTGINKVILQKDKALLDAEKYTITAEQVVLCTNGFVNITIINEAGLGINTKFHHMLRGTVGYMSGYIEKMNKPPTAISYLTDTGSDTNEPYFYLTRRAYEYEDDKGSNLISIGGPEVAINDTKEYSRENDYPEEIEDKINTFVRSTYDTEPNKEIDYIFTWHGLMGYTENGVRLVGPEPKNNILMYNLGCNGVGILPSVFGGKRISEYVSGKPVGKSMFDVPEKYKQES